MTKAPLFVAFIAAAAGSAWGQCPPAWDVTAGNPGIGGGYAAAVRGWNDGNGERLYVGGSFTTAGGSGAGRYLARWNPATNSWSALGGGISPGFTNAFLTSLATFNPGNGERLVAGGFFDTAGGVASTASLAMWNGSTWEAMGTGWTGTTRGSIWAMASWNARLYVAGGVVNTPATIGGQPWAGMASWNGTSWTPTITTVGGSFSPFISAMQVFNDGSGEALYIAGRFTGIENVAGTACIARWNGSAWSSVGGGLTSTSTLFGPEALTVFDDGTGPALFIAGYAFFGPGMPTANVAKWNGTSWTAVGAQIGTGRITSMVGFNDGNGAKLYIGGTAMPQMNYIARWENSAWTPVGGGVPVPAQPPWPSVFGLGVWQNKLYTAGDYTQIGTSAASGMAAWTSCAASCYANCDNSTVAPILNVNDFICFLNRFAAGDSYANCDQSTQPPTLNVLDFTCFLNRFAAGCT